MISDIIINVFLGSLLSLCGAIALFVFLNNKHSRTDDVDSNASHQQVDDLAQEEQEESAGLMGESEDSSEARQIREIFMGKRK